MRIAYLCLAYDQFEYISSLAEYCNDESDSFYLHVDSKVVIPEFIYQDKIHDKYVCAIFYLGGFDSRQNTSAGCDSYLQ